VTPLAVDRGCHFQQASSEQRGQDHEGTGHRSRRFSCRQITRLDEASGHQTQIVTTREAPDAGVVAYAMFSRWRQENFFRYQRAHFGLDALDAYETTADDLSRMVANPLRRDADRVVKEAKGSLAKAEAKEGKSALDGDRPDAELRMATYNSESALARMIAPHYARADDEARTLLSEIFSARGDLEIDGDRLHVRINALAAPRRTRALAGLCEELTATETVYPGTTLTLVYSVKER